MKRRSMVSIEDITDREKREFKPGGTEAELHAEKKQKKTELTDVMQFIESDLFKCEQRGGG